MSRRVTWCPVDRSNGATGVLVLLAEPGQQNLNRCQVPSSNRSEEDHGNRPSAGPEAPSRSRARPCPGDLRARLAATRPSSPSRGTVGFRRRGGIRPGLAEKVAEVTHPSLVASLRYAAHGSTAAAVAVRSSGQVDQPERPIPAGLRGESPIQINPLFGPGRRGRWRSASVRRQGAACVACHETRGAGCLEVSLWWHPAGWPQLGRPGGREGLS